LANNLADEKHMKKAEREAARCLAKKRWKMKVGRYA